MKVWSQNKILIEAEQQFNIQNPKEPTAYFKAELPLDNPKNIEFEIKKAQKEGYRVEVNIIAVNEYDFLQKTFNRYATQYRDKSKGVKLIEPSLIQKSKESILQTIDTIDKLKVDKFTIVNKEMEILYKQNKNYKQKPKDIIEKKIDLKNWNKPKIDKLIESWNRVISKLENIKAPEKIQESAKNIKKDLIDLVKSLQKTKPKLNQQKRDQILEKLKQSNAKEKEIGVQR